MDKYKKDNSLEKRKSECARVRERHPTKLPILVFRDKNSKNIDIIEKNKYLVPYDITFGQFSYIVRKKINLKPEMAMFMFVGKLIPSTSQIICEIYDSHKEEDGFLYITYSGENTFG